MKRALLLTLAGLTLHTTASAEIVEANVVIQFKKHVQLPVVTAPNGIATQKVMVSAFKTADAIQQIGIGQGKSFTPKAKLIYQTIHTANQRTSHFIVRDSGTDFDVTECIVLVYPPHITGADPEVSQSKGGGNPPVGIIKNFAYYALTILPNTTTPKLQLHGPNNYSQRLVASKEVANTSYPITTVSFNGIGTFGLPSATSQPDQGVIQGSFKITGAKVIKTD